MTPDEMARMLRAAADYFERRTLVNRGPHGGSERDSALRSIRAAADMLERPLTEKPCDVETWSWEHFNQEQMDGYWIRCTQVGPHDEHEDANTGLTWRDRTNPEKKEVRL